MADPFHQIAVAGDHISPVIDKVIAEARIHDALGQRHANRRRNALAQGPGRRFDSGRVAVFRMPCAGGIDLAEPPYVLERDGRIARQIEQGIKQHRAVPGR